MKILMQALFYAFFIILLVCLALFEQYMISNIYIAATKLETLNNLQEKEIDLFIEMNHTPTTLATLAIGAIGILISSRYKGVPLPWGQRLRAVGCWGFAGASLYFGYVSLHVLSLSLGRGFLDLSIPQVLWQRQMQFYTLIISVFLLADFVFRSLGEVKESNKASK
jgi:hypothetical protein